MATAMIIFLLWSVFINTWTFFKFGAGSEVTVYVVKALALLATVFSIYQLFKIV